MDAGPEGCRRSFDIVKVNATDSRARISPDDPGTAIFTQSLLGSDRTARLDSPRLEYRYRLTHLHFGFNEHLNDEEKSCCMQPGFAGGFAARARQLVSFSRPRSPQCREPAHLAEFRVQRRHRRVR